MSEMNVYDDEGAHFQVCPEPEGNKLGIAGQHSLQEMLHTVTKENDGHNSLLFRRTGFLVDKQCSREAVVRKRKADGRNKAEPRDAAGVRC